jgi:cobalt/nickel transport system permease protein
MLALHIPDGFLPPGLALAGWALALGPLLWALHLAGRKLEDRLLPRMGLLACFVLVAQGLQVPLPGGTSAHLQGSALAALALGPSAAVVVLTAVLGIQALVLGDGGLLTLGWNLVNMALLGVGVAVVVDRLGGRLRLPRSARVVAAAWLSVEVSTLATCLELAAAGTSPLALSLPVMLTTQGLVGAGEALVTLGALRVLRV